MRLIFLLILAGCASGQVHLENDYGAFFNKNNDKNYTNGAKFSSYHYSENQKETFSIGQSLYTPAFKKEDATDEQLRSSRPYTAWLYGEYRIQQKIEKGRSTIFGIQAGCSGRCAYGKETQRTIHKLLGQGYPTWDRNYSLKSEPGIILEGEKYYDIRRTSDFDSQYYVRGKLGNIIDNLSFGLNFRYGHGLQSFDPEAITFKKTVDEGKSEWFYYFFGDAELRAVPYNHFLEGSLFQNEPHTVDANWIVGEGNLGFRVGYDRFKFSYNYTVITDEWSEQGGPFFFGGIDFSW